MIESFTIRNFRSFNDVTIRNSRKVNVLVGDNGSGKTALLEAIFLAAGISPELVMRTRGWRGSAPGQIQGTIEDIHNELWSDLFYKFQTSKPAYIKLEGKGDENRSVTVTLKKLGARRVIPPSRRRPQERPRVITENPDTPIQFRWTIQSFGDLISEPYFLENRLIFPQTPADPIKAIFFASNQGVQQNETAARFSSLSQSFLDHDFTDRFNQIYPRVRNLSVEINLGVPVLFASVDGLPRKIPLGLASGGMNKLVAILLGMAAQASAIVLIDEVENGFYHRHMDLIWKALFDFARQYDCQLFVSTHSAECLEAVARLAQQNPAEFSMMRAVNTGDGTLIRQFDGERFSHAILDDVEVR